MKVWKFLERGSERVYEPREDSHLMVEAVKKVNEASGVGELALDMGTGTGVVACELAARFREVWAVDVNPDILNLEWPKNVKVVVSDLFEKVGRQAEFDLITFNPPYLPEPYEDDRELNCGKGAILKKFLEGARGRLKPGGRVLLLLSSLTPKLDFSGWRTREVARLKLGFEELRVWELQPG